MKVTALNEHPEKVGHHKIVVYGRNQSAPRLKKKTQTNINTEKENPAPPTGERRQRRYLVTLVDVVVDQLQQEPHHVPQYEGGDQIPVDDVTEAPYAPGWGTKTALFTHVWLLWCCSTCLAEQMENLTGCRTFNYLATVSV